jgi:hypothetical protein
MAASVSSTAAAVSVLVAAAGAAAANEAATVVAEAPGRRKRARTPKIDIDALIAQHMANMKNAKKLESEAKKMVRNEKRKKQRLMKKASSLTPDDLERIAVLKRCGLWDPANGVRMMTASERVAAESEVAVASAAATTTPASGPDPPVTSAASAPSPSEEDGDASS